MMKIELTKIGKYMRAAGVCVSDVGVTDPELLGNLWYEKEEERLKCIKKIMTCLVIISVIKLQLTQKNGIYIF